MGRRLIQNIKEHKFKADEHLLLDANIWLYTYGPAEIRSEDINHIYNDAMTEMIINKCNLYMTLPILSEYVYRYLSKQLELNGISKKDLKAFRKLGGYKKILDGIEADMKEILDIANINCCNSAFENSKAFELLDVFLRCTLDFNDVIIEDFCMANPNIILVTNDGDFKYSSIPIITANTSMF